MRRQRHVAPIGFGEGRTPKRRQYAAVSFGETHPNSVDAVHARRQERAAARSMQHWRAANPEIDNPRWYTAVFRWARRKLPTLRVSTTRDRRHW